MIYPVMVSPDDGPGYVVMLDRPALAASSGQARCMGWLGTEHGISQTALGVFDTPADAQRVARKSLGYAPHQGFLDAHGIFR